MPSQQRFEGPELEELLDEVRGRFGPDVPIVEANRVRKGGVGGFFARELFEVVVEAGDAPHDEPTTGGHGLMDLVAAVDDGPGPSLSHDAGHGRLASPETVEDLLRRTGGEPMPDPPSSGGRSPDVAALLDELGESRARGTAPVHADQATLSTDGDAFAEVLERIAHSTQTRATPPAPPAERDDDVPFRSFAEAARREATPVRGRRSRAADDGAPSGGCMLDLGTLGRLGLPASLLERPLRAADRISGLLELAETFPRARDLPRGPDTVIAMVGDRTAMERATAWVNEQLGLHPDRLMLATRSDSRVFPDERRIWDHDRAAALRGAWRRRDHPVLVAVDSPVGLRQTTWARHVLDALEPSAVWAVVDAQRKPEDVVEWAERIGGVDAIALDRTEETASPAAVLTTGLPVSLLDGHQATPARWAAVLDERMLVA